MKHTIFRFTIGLIFLLLLLVSCVDFTPAELAPTETPSFPTATAIFAPTPTTTVAPITVPIVPAIPLATGCTRHALRTEDEVVIGALYPLSNPQMMVNGFAMLAAANLAVADINERGGIGGKPIRSIVYDSASDPAQGALFAERLITIDCVAAIVGVFHSDVAMAVKDVAIQYHIPVLFADPYADEITDDWAPEVFRIAPTHTMLIRTMSEWLANVGDYNKDGERLAVFITEDSPSGRMRLQRLETELPPTGIRVAGFPIDLPATDFSPVIARIVALDHLPDAVFLYLHNGDVIPLAKQLIDAGIGPERGSLLITTSKILDDQIFWKEIPNGNYLIAMQNGPWPSTVSSIGQSFAQRFQQYFHRWPEGSAFESYDTLWLIANAIGRAESVAPDALIKALEETDVTLAAGHYRFPYGSQSPPNEEKIGNYMWHQWPTPPILYLQYTTPNQPSSQMRVIWPPTYSNSNTPLAQELIAQITP